MLAQYAARCSNLASPTRRDLCEPNAIRQYLLPKFDVLGALQQVDRLPLPWWFRQPVVRRCPRADLPLLRRQWRLGQRPSAVAAASSPLVASSSLNKSRSLSKSVVASHALILRKTSRAQIIATPSAHTAAPSITSSVIAELESDEATGVFRLVMTAKVSRYSPANGDHIAVPEAGGL